MKQLALFAWLLVVPAVATEHVWKVEVQAPGKPPRLMKFTHSGNYPLPSPGGWSCEVVLEPPLQVSDGPRLFPANVWCRSGDVAVCSDRHLFLKTRDAEFMYFFPE